MFCVAAALGGARAVVGCGDDGGGGASPDASASSSSSSGASGTSSSGSSSSSSSSGGTGDAGPIGTLDPAFGTNGIVVMSPSASYTDVQVTAIAPYPDGRLAVAAEGRNNGNLFELRVALLANGQPDPALTTASRIGISSGKIASVADMLVSTDESLLRVGRFGDDAVSRIHVDGGEVASFGDGAGTNVRAMLLEGADRLVLFGKVRTDHDVLKFVRHIGDGGLDPSFGGTGSVIVQTNVSASDFARGVVRTGALGSYVGAVSLGQAGCVITRVGSGGDKDLAFGGGDAGYRVFREPVFATLLSDGDGYVLVGTRNDSAVARLGGWFLRLTSGGEVDVASNSAEGRFVDIGKGLRVQDAALLADGTIVLVGSRDDGVGPAKGVVVRATRAGTLVASFGTAGVIELPFRPNRVVLDAQSRIVVAGGSGGVNVARVLP